MRKKEATLVTGHRGMGVLEKPRHEFLEGEAFFPENSTAAFKEAIRQGADALECDIHVSKDGQAMVIHGSKIFQYADYIGPQTETGVGQDLIQKDLSPYYLKGGDDIEVEKFIREELQSQFALKSYKSEFDKLPKEDKSRIINAATDEARTEKEAVIQEKRRQLEEQPEFHTVPTLKKLMGVALEANRERQIAGKPLLKLNIELKGKGSAIASLSAIKQFYEENAEAQALLPPENLVFLGRREVGEVTIANALLKRTWTIEEGKVDIPELRDQFREDVLSDREECNRLREAFDRTSQEKANVITNIRMVFEAANIDLKEKGLVGMEAQILGSSYQAIGGSLDELGNNLKHPGFWERLGEERQELLKSALEQKSGESKGDLKKIAKEAKKAEKEARVNKALLKQAFEKAGIIFDDKEFKGVETELLTQIIQVAGGNPERTLKENIDALPPETIAITIERVCSEFREEAVRARDADTSQVLGSEKGNNLYQMMMSPLGDFEQFQNRHIELSWLQTKKNINAQLDQQFGTVEKACDYCSGALGNARTNLMLTTGQLFGGDAIANQVDFDTNPAVWEISIKGATRIWDAFTKYRYDGIDISLYDFTPALIETVNHAVEKAGVQDRAILGVTASNWKGSQQENSLTDPCFAVTRSEAIAEQCNMPVLLKVDEPGVFKDLLLRSRSIDRSTLSFGPETTLAVTDVEISPRAPTKQQGRVSSLALEEGILGTMAKQIGSEIHKISSKPPRGPRKDDLYLEGKYQEEVENIKRGFYASEEADSVAKSSSSSSREEDGIERRLLENEVVRASFNGLPREIIDKLLRESHKAVRGIDVSDAADVGGSSILGKIHQAVPFQNEAKKESVNGKSGL